MRVKLALGVAVAVAAVVVAPGVAGVRPHGDGIHVNGVWTLQFKTKSGKVFARRHFENALTASGAKTLIKVLARGGSVGRWSVEINGANTATTAHPCGSVSVQFCWISAEPDATSGFVGPVSKNLVVTNDQTTPQLTLSGNVTVDADASVGQVVSGIMTCAAGTLVADCKGGSVSLFTLASVSPQVAVTSGQQVAITVHFTFS